MDAHAIVGYVGCLVGRGEREARGRDGFALLFFGGEGEVEIEEECQRVGGDGHAVGGADGGVEAPMGVAERVGAGSSRVR